MRHDIHTPAVIRFPDNSRLWGKRAGLCRCRESVREPGQWPRYNQCQRTGTVSETIDGEVMWFCKTHSATEQQARQDARDDKHDAERKRRSDEFKAPRYRAALELIANGTNDARAVARAALGITDDKPETY